MICNCDRFCSTHCFYARKARIFLLVDLQDFFFRFRVEGTKKNEIKRL